MNKRRIAGICALVASLLLAFTAVATNWYSAERGRRTLNVGPMLVKACRGDRCETEALMKDARGDQEAWAGAGLAFAGIGSITALLLLIFGIIAVVGKGGMGIGITGIVFAGLTNLCGGAFVGLRPENMAFLEKGAGIYLSSLGGMLGIAFGILMIIARRDGRAAAPPGYGAPPAPGAPPGWTPPAAPGAPGMPPQQ